MQCRRGALAVLAITLPNALNAAHFVQTQRSSKARAPGVEAQPSSQSPVEQVVNLLSELKARVEADGAEEQAAYDKFACWCEETLANKAKDIAKGQESAEALRTEITKFRGNLGAFGASIEQTKKDIAANIAQQKEATDVRTNERTVYQEAKTESEQAVGALEAAINVLAGAGGGKKGFLETLQETQLMSAAAGIRGLLGNAVVAQTMTADQLSVVRRFVSQPEEFFSQPINGGLSAAQIASNPFGDYSPRSTQIQGILKSMYDSFTSDLERDNGEEAVKQKSFEAIMQTKKTELATLEATLRQQTTDEADRSKQVADDRALVDETEAQLAADKAFFQDSKDSCRSKAADWSQRTRLRTAELNGFATAIAILSSPDAQKTFQNASAALLQVRSTKAVRSSHLGRVKKMLMSFGAAHIASLIAAGGHFDNVISAIDIMIASLRREEQEDIAHRDRCEGKSTQNEHNIEDLNYSIDRIGSEVQRLEGEASQIQQKIEALDIQIKATSDDKIDLLAMRAKEHDDFIKAVKDDADAIKLLEQAIVTLTKFYKNAGIPIGLVQAQTAQSPGPGPPAGLAPASPPAPALAPAPAAYAPAAPTGTYGGRKGESQGIIAILSMLKEDFEKETSVAREQDAKAQIIFEQDEKAIDTMLSSQQASRAELSTTLAGFDQKNADLEEQKNRDENDLNGENDRKQAIYLDCSWVKSQIFEDRRTKRKTEMDGLTEAKNYLAGVEAGSEVP